MNNFFFLVTVCVISFYSEKTDAMNIQCSFQIQNYYGFGAKKGCTVESVTLSSPEDREITSVNGESYKTYNDVWWFYSQSITFNNFPKNIKKIFTNVESVSIYTANITTLTKSDMAPLGSQMRRFAINDNNIEVLEEGLFDENPNLEDIQFPTNKIKFVASGVFDKLSKLKSLNFQSNPCHSGSAYNDRAKVLNMISQIKGNCQDHQTTTTTTTSTTTEKVKSEHELRIEELTAEVAELKRQQLADDKQHQEELQKNQKKLQKLNEEHNAETSLKDAKNKQLEERIEGLKKELAAVKPCDELHEVRDSLMSKFKELETKIEGKFDKTNEKIDTTKDMIIKSTQEKLDSTLVKPMSSLHAKMDTFDLKLDTSDEKFESLNATCVGLDYKLNLLECVRMP